MLVTEDLSEAAEKAVKMAAILRMARDARISINLTSWFREKKKQAHISFIYYLPLISLPKIHMHVRMYKKCVYV